MSLLTFVITLCILGVVWYLVTTYLPMPDIAKTILNIVFVIVAILLVLALFGIMSMPFALK